MHIATSNKHICVRETRDNKHVLQFNQLKL
uniref:Uncharacterized protein n=1 Tax=Podoviridae sp. ctsNK10 TaxID=2826582 RepID=A0A8S5NMC6_9CAUD|nr:MAG TPA: hypothetical protein [Podoviridae sp. ctsNK10]